MSHQNDPGEGGLTAQENELIALRNRVLQLERIYDALRRESRALREVLEDRGCQRGNPSGCFDSSPVIDGQIAACATCSVLAEDFR